MKKYEQSLHYHQVLKHMAIAADLRSHCRVTWPQLIPFLVPCITKPRKIDFQIKNKGRSTCGEVFSTLIVGFEGLWRFPALDMLHFVYWFVFRKTGAIC